ncbi:hypothetical protein CL629_02265 [bacterium]|nr:hypothetical protein [bacterium]
MTYSTNGNGPKTARNYGAFGVIKRGFEGELADSASGVRFFSKRPLRHYSFFKVLGKKFAFCDVYLSLSLSFEFEYLFYY